MRYNALLFFQNVFSFFLFKNKTLATETVLRRKSLNFHSTFVFCTIFDWKLFQIHYIYDAKLNPLFFQYAAVYWKNDLCSSLKPVLFRVERKVRWSCIYTLSKSGFRESSLRINMYFQNYIKFGQWLGEDEIKTLFYKNSKFWCYLLLKTFLKLDLLASWSPL